MPHLDNRSTIKQLDPNNYISHILDVPEQLLEGYSLANSIIIPALYAQAKQVVILTVGEMLPVAMALQALMLEYGRIPIETVDDFVLPHYVSSDTLVIALDYYGESEQVRTCFREAAKRRARLLTVSVEGDLGREARRYRAPYIALAYGSPARAAFFYALSCLAQIFKKLDFIELKETTINEASVLCRSLLQTINPEVPQYKNTAKQLAEKLATKHPLLVASGPMVALAKKWQVNLANTGKTIAVTSTVGEFNETLINGVGHQGKSDDSFMIIVLQSKYDHIRNKFHQTLIHQVAQAHKLTYEPIFMHPSGSLFGEIVLCGVLGEMVSYYVALLANQDPSLNEATLYIKEQLQHQPMSDHK